MENKHTKGELQQYQSLSLDSKIRMSKRRIQAWVDEFGEDGCYISFSGGKDSRVLVHLVKEVAPNVPVVYVNTGLEYNSVREKGMELADTVLLPKKSFHEVVTQYGYPVISKEVSQAVDEGKRYMKALTDRQTDRQTDDSVCLSDSRLLGSGQTNTERQRIIQEYQDRGYP